MQTHITARHAAIPDGLRAHIEDSVGKLERYYGGIQEARVVLDGHESGAAAKTAEVSVTVRRGHLKAQGSGATHQEAVSGCVRQLRRQVQRYKDRVRSTKRDEHR